MNELHSFVERERESRPVNKERMMPKLTLAGASVLALMAASPSLAQELNALVWCDHTDPALIAPFEQKFGVKVNLKEYEGTAAGLAILDQSQPGDWDVLVIDAVDVGRAVEAVISFPNWSWPRTTWWMARPMR
jgi:spermidine/putrescine-binding protein